MKASWTWIKENKLIIVAAIVICVLAYNTIVG